jgi:hypothetical protein
VYYSRDELIIYLYSAKSFPKKKERRINNCIIIADLFSTKMSANIESHNNIPQSSATHRVYNNAETISMHHHYSCVSISVKSIRKLNFFLHEIAYFDDTHMVPNKKNYTNNV